MYTPAHFAQTDTARLHALVRQHPLATWVVPGADGLLINHVPFHLEALPDGCDVLRAHVARANPVWQALAAAGESVLVFQGPEAYVSPGWYPSKQRHGKMVPTWNYAVAHAHGQARAVDDRAWLQALLNRLTHHHEAAMPQPWAMADAPADYIDRMLAAVVGIEFEVQRWAGKFKASQNHAAEDRDGVVQGLSQRAQRLADDPAAHPAAEGPAAMAELVKASVR